ncbi:rho GTPase-activating protein SYDE1 [Denticeps clupeoides]|uniref:rho GTPase-activating protein SYDE1 n=1 Tax=Denticeps clupeoides TaxID=299321 RepID=UPI0010A34A43|nr:rho GTPase-activating protein SYDE1 [Denticeps clupeoides]
MLDSHALLGVLAAPGNFSAAGVTLEGSPGMAEPLLKRTFSRLRGKEKSRRKTDPKLPDVQGKTDVQICSSLSAQNSAAAEEDYARRPQITVAKKQNWAKLTSRDPPRTEACSRPEQRGQEYGSFLGKTQGSKQAWSQKALSEESRSTDSGWEAGTSSSLWNSNEAGLPELSPPMGAGYSEVSIAPSSAKLSGQGAYLQSLERSSRAWVLSTGKSQGSEELPRPLPSSITEWKQGVEGERNIWYNPIPEEEDSRMDGTGGDFGDPWRRRAEMEGSPESRRDGPKWAQKRAGMLVGNCASSSCRETSADNSDVFPQKVQQVDCECLGVAVSTVVIGTPSDSPAMHKKSSGLAVGSSSMMDKIKSPGTVRRLSMKMRKLPELRRKLSLRSSRLQRHGNSQNAATATGAEETSPPNARKESSNNVISRYHLDSSAPSAHTRRRLSRPRSASKGGYLSDGDSPELLPKQGSSGGQESSSTPSFMADAGSFRLYSLAEQPRCAQRLSGLLTVHLLGVEELLRSPRNSASKGVFCAIQVDGVTRGRTALLTCCGPSLPLNHTFNLELERARLLKLVVLTPATPNITSADSLSPATNATATRNRVCCLGAVAIPPLFRGGRSQQLCVQLEPRGLLYVKLTLLEQWEAPSPRLSEMPPPSVFGVDLRRLVEKENLALKVPIIIQKCVAEIEKRGLKVVGLYRLCGSAAVKKELRDMFERDSASVTLSEDLYPDINVITGILKDYLRELPSPLITRTLYEVVLESMSVRPVCRSELDAQRCQATVSLLQCLPEPEKATLTLLLDHLSLVASFSDSNRMTCQNLAVCFGPVLLTPTQECWMPSAQRVPAAAHAPAPDAGRTGRSFAHSEEIASAVDFKHHIEALHYLLQLWPIPTGRILDDPPLSASIIDSPPPSPSSSPSVSQNTLRHKNQRPPLHLDLSEDLVVSRRGRGRLESPPCNRYAGDWSICGRDFLSGLEADYDEVAGSNSEQEEDEDEQQASAGLYVDDFGLDFDAPFTCRLSLKDFDTLISDLERELAKQINICL